MKVLVSWINEFLEEQLSPEQVAEAMEKAGIEVEDIIYPPQFNEGIVVAEITKVEAHPSADKLSVVNINSGSNTHQLVCGADNLYVGQKVAYVSPGSTLPGGTVIEKATIREVESEGMLASEKELELGTNHAGILDLDKSLSSGTPLNMVYGTEATVIDVSLAANRIDLLSIAGIAREVALYSHNQLKLLPRRGEDSRVDIQELVGKLFDNQIGEILERYMLVKVLLPKNPASPGWLRHRLQASGVKPVNLIVDITNYVMLEYGQPLHAFDAHKVKGEVVVRYAKDGEKLKTLDGTDRTLSNEDVVIADQQKVLALAGVMGGEACRVDENTKSILLEAAVFPAPLVRKSAQRHLLRTEASARFERSLPSELPLLGMVRALDLLEELGAGAADELQDEVNVKHVEIKVNFSQNRLQTLTGVEIDEETIKSLEKIGFSLTKTEDDKWEARVPFWRPDVVLAEDILEELVKIIGLENIPARLPDLIIKELKADKWIPFINQLRQGLRGLGMNEVITYPFVSPEQLKTLNLEPSEHLKLKNPRSTQQQYLQSSMLPSLLEAVANNFRTHEEFGFFEQGRNYLGARENEYEEEKALGVIFCGANAYRRVKNVVDNIAVLLNISLSLEQKNKKSFLHPGRQIGVIANGEQLGYIGQLHPGVLKQHKITEEVAFLQLNLEKLFLTKQEVKVIPVSKYQPSRRDITVIVENDTDWQDVKKAFTDTPETEITYLEEYFGKGIEEGQKALTLRLNFNPQTKTLTDKEIDERLQQILEILENNFKARLQEQ
ncbi:MAG: phenylalanine--tRNA ligase subunit beta [Candidatus Saccharimonadales bacterium]